MAVTLSLNSVSGIDAAAGARLAVLAASPQWGILDNGLPLSLTSR